MGCGSSKCCNEEMRQLRERNKLLEEELRKNLRMREEDSKVGLRKEEEWKDERKRLVDVYVMMRKKMDEETSGGGTNGCYLAVEKWKQLYFAIKTELDHLILRTAQGDLGEGLKYKSNEGEKKIVDILQRELKAKDVTLELVRARLSSMEKEATKRDREIDILRQSFRILTAANRITHVRTENQTSSKKGQSSRDNNLGSNKVAKLLVS